jgi:uncharacterized membrane protein YfcA
MSDWILSISAGFIAGIANAIAGGGSFITFPALIFLGVPSVIANASSTVALFPGSLASSWAYRRELAPFGAVRLSALLLVSVIGGALGALLLLKTPVTGFDRIVPWLLLLATAAFAGGPQAGAALRRRIELGKTPILLLQFGLAIYGGYFGGAVGLMMMAVWGLLTEVDLKALNPAKTLLVAATNAVAVLCFILAGIVRWPETLAMLAAALLGGYAGALAGRRLPAGLVRGAVILITATMTLLFFWRSA